MRAAMRTRLFAEPGNELLHDAILHACQRFGGREALVDTSSGRRISYSEYAEMVESAARGLVAAGLRPGEVIAIYLPNCWEYAVTYHAATLAGAIPTLLNPSYREREVRYQLADSGAVFLVTDAGRISAMDLKGLPALRKIFFTRSGSGDMFSGLLHSGLLQMRGGSVGKQSLPKQDAPADTTVAALPYSSGTTGLPKGVMLSHANLVTNCYQLLAPGEMGTPREGDRLLCFLPLYHIYGLNVVLNPSLLCGATAVLAPRFDVDAACKLLLEERITYLPMVPPMMNALCTAAEAGRFPKEHTVRGAKSGAAPLAAGLARRFTALTGIRVRQGYGMTEASPVTHLGYLEADRYRPDTIGQAVALTECKLVDERGGDVADGAPGELVMRGPQFMMGYWNAPEATREALRPDAAGKTWYWSGDIATRDAEGFYRIVDRRKELIKYKGFAVAPAEVEAVLLEHAAVRDCGVIGRADDAAGELPVAFVVLKNGQQPSPGLEAKLCGYVAERLTSYKQPREVRFVDSIPRNPSGKILRKDLRSQL